MVLLSLVSCYTIATSLERSQNASMYAMLVVMHDELPACYSLLLLRPTPKSAFYSETPRQAKQGISCRERNTPNSKPVKDKKRNPILLRCCHWSAGQARFHWSVDQARCHEFAGRAWQQEAMAQVVGVRDMSFGWPVSQNP